MQLELSDDRRAACRKARVPLELWESFYENCPEARLWRQRERDENMLAAHKSGWSTQRIAEELGVSLRTVQLGIRRARTAEVAESPDQRLATLRRMIARAKESQARLPFTPYSLRKHHAAGASPRLRHQPRCAPFV